MLKKKVNFNRKCIRGGSRECRVEHFPKLNFSDGLQNGKTKWGIVGGLVSTEQGSWGFIL